MEEARNKCYFSSVSFYFYFKQKLVSKSANSGEKFPKIESWRGGLQFQEINFKTHPKFKSEFQDPPKVSRGISRPTQNFIKTFVTPPISRISFFWMIVHKTRLLVLSNFTSPTFQRLLNFFWPEGV